MHSRVKAEIIGGFFLIIAAMIGGGVSFNWGMEYGLDMQDLAILDVLQFPVWVIDPQFKVIKLNTTAEDYYGRTQEEVLDWTVEDLIEESGKYFINPNDAKDAKAHWRYHLELARTGSFTPMKTPPFLVQFAVAKVYMATHAHRVESGRLAGHYIVFDQIIPQDQALCALRSGENPTVAEALKVNRRIEVIIKELATQ